VPEVGHAGEVLFLVTGKDELRYSYFYQDYHGNSKAGTRILHVKTRQVGASGYGEAAPVAAGQGERLKRAARRSF
jgi:hypothetical protein